MKRSCLLFLLLLISFYSFAQKSFIAGVEFSGGMFYNGNTDFPISFAGGANIYAGLMLTNAKGIVTGIGVNHFEYFIKTGPVTSLKQTLEYIDVPLLFRLESKKSKANARTNMYLNAGVVLGFLSKASIEGSTHIGHIGGDSYDYNNRGEFFAMNIRPYVAAGFNFIVAKELSVTLGCNLSSGVRDQHKSRGIENVNNNNSLTMYGLKLGLQYKFNK